MIPDAVAPVGATTSDAAATAEIPQVRSKQDQKIANDLADGHKLIQSALDSPELIAVLTESGYDETELNAGYALWETAQEAFDARQSASAVAAQSKADRDELFEKARAEFVAYREAVQVDYIGAERAALGASGRIPADLERFTTAVRAAYAAGQKEPYATKLTKNGFSGVRLKAGLAQINQFALSDAKFKQDDRATTEATATRDREAKALAKWIGKFRKLAKSKLQDKPSLRAELGV